MNPRLVKFAVELQNHEVKIEEKKVFYFHKNKFLNFLKEAFVTIPVEVHTDK